ncbi:MAG: ketosteroid isomerase [Caulobacter vibrioides]|uniref:Ketosteroid isomerase n=1 Tax=Caulobacter vibrioides TaxID=155892 RepID=A0A258D764_CAUVI|nr:MAG: ketosteroid isomerase [Caulobacter vibrioides]
MSQIDYEAFAQRFVAAIQAGDAEAVRAFYAPDAKIWHNIDHIEQTVDQNLKSLAWFVRTLPDRTYRVQRIAPLPDGFLQQHVLEATLPNGERWAMDACVVVRVENGKITRLDEYLDSAKTAQLVAATR